MNRSELELCCVCGEATGRAGRFDDSLYINDDGPFCEDCYKDTITKERANEPT